MNKPSQTPPILRPLLIGLCVGAVCCTLLLLAAACLLSSVDLPLDVATPTAVVAAALSSFIGGLTAARTAGSRGLLMGSACGVMLFLVILLCGLCRGGVDGGYAAVKLAALTLAGAGGGVLGVNRKRR